MRVVITGGAGFLGSHLCQRLIGLEHEVTCIDNLITGSMDNVVHLMGHERFTFVNTMSATICTWRGLWTR